MVALIDADSLIYKTGFTFEQKFDWNELELELGIENEPDTYIEGDLLSAKNAIDGLIESILFNTGCDSAELWLTGDGNFRYDVLDSYKSNRKGSRKPTDYTGIWNYLVDSYGAHVARGYEADDVVVYKKTHDPEEYFLCAIDKDVIYQCEGTHYNYNKDEFITVKLEEAERFFYEQVLTGDVVDGYKGCPGIGKARATKILDKAEEDEVPYWELIIEAYEAKNLTEDDAIQQARMASMHQLKEDSKGDYKVDLWKP